MSQRYHLFAVIGAVVAVSIGAFVVFYRPESAYTPNLAAGIDHYAKHCVSCHGAAGEGLFGNPALDDPEVRDLAAEEIFDTVSKGVIDTAMVAYSDRRGGLLSDHTLRDLVLVIQTADWLAVALRVDELGLTPPENYIVNLSDEQRAQIAQLSGGEQMVRGLLTYGEYCATCHGGNGEGTIAGVELNADTFRADYTSQEIIDIVMDGVDDTRMAGWREDLPTADIDDVTAFLQRWDNLNALGLVFEMPEDLPIDMSPERIARGQKLFATYCTRCHGNRGQGTLIAPTLNDPVFLSENPNHRIRQLIMQGVPDTLMAGWEGYLADEDIFALNAFIRAWETTE